MILLLVAASLVPMQVLAAKKLISEYDGQVKYVEGYDGKVGDACVATITQSESFDGPLNFPLNDSELFYSNKDKVLADLGTGNKKIEVKNKKTTAQEGIEILNLHLRKKGSLNVLKLSRIIPSQIQVNALSVLEITSGRIRLRKNFDGNEAKKLLDSSPTCFFCEKVLAF